VVPVSVERQGGCRDPSAARSDAQKPRDRKNRVALVGMTEGRAEKSGDEEAREHRPFGFAQGKQECLCHWRRSFFGKSWENGISFLTLGKCGLISNFGVNFPRMSASSELEPHPSCPRVRSSQLTAFPASEVCCAGAEVRAGRASRGGFTDG
jgi:hypothetical protein